MKIQKKLSMTLAVAMITIGFMASNSCAAPVSCQDTKIVGVGYYPGQADTANGKSGYRVNPVTTSQKNPAATYSPTKSPWQYHRRRRA